MTATTLSEILQGQNLGRFYQGGWSQTQTGAAGSLPPSWLQTWLGSHVGFKHPALTLGFASQMEECLPHLKTHQHALLVTTNLR